MQKKFQPHTVKMNFLSSAGNVIPALQPLKLIHIDLASDFLISFGACFLCYDSALDYVGVHIHTLMTEHVCIIASE